MGSVTTYYCDRCGTKIEDFYEDSKLVFLAKDDMFFRSGLENAKNLFCTECFQGFVHWFKNP